MNEIEELRNRLTAVEDRLAIIDLRARYCHLLDGQDWPALMDIYTDDVVQVGAEPAHGKEELLSFFKSVVPGSFDAMWHRSSSETITLDGDKASGQCQFDVPCVQNGVPMLCAGRYDDDFRRCQDGRWRISRRILTFYYFTPLSDGWKPGAVSVLDEAGSNTAVSR